jgi:3-phenylpropionate/cinnamic acid dioxygenase small subunit
VGTHDEEDIADVLVRYATGIDRKDWSLFRTCFTTDVVADYTDIARWEGVDAITEFMAAAHVGMGHTMHRLSNLVVAVDGDTATARTYVDSLLMTPDGQAGVHAAGFYDDELVRTSDGWRIAQRIFTPVHTGTIG